jgi:RNA polymerase-binding transcription factor DksA
MNSTAVKSQSELSRIDEAVIRSQLSALRATLEASEGGRARLRLLQVEAALRKLDRGVYGFCDACSKPVVKARLLAMPFVRYCVSCGS